GDHDQLRHVPRNQILAHRVLECRADDRVDLLDRGRALALPSLRPEELPQIRRGQLTQGLGAERGHDVVPDITFIRLIGRRAQPRFLDVAHPGFQECLHGKTARSRRDARAGRLLHLGELRADLFASLPVRRLPPTGAVRGENVRRTSPPTVLAPGDAALAVGATHATTGAGSRLSTYARRSVALTSRERPSLTLGSSPQRIRSYTRVFETLSRSATSSAVKQSFSMVLSFLVESEGGAARVLPCACCIGGGAGEFGISGGEPALSGEAELVDHDGGLGVFGRVSDPRGGSGGLELLAVAVVLVPRVAKRSEGGGEPAGFTGEVT